MYRLVMVWIGIVSLVAGRVGHTDEVRVWEEEIVIPTYQADFPEEIPLFYDGRTYQGAQGHVYPYPMSDRLLHAKTDQTYHAVYLENEYIRICVLPEIGGRIFSAVDKSNQYDFFYRQSVIKPTLIGMLGKWISGGVEWNFPHHHRSRSYMKMDVAIEDNPDGGKTVWMGETEWRHRMRLVIGLTLYPDCSYLEASINMFNRTPLIHSFLYWANPAVHVNPNYQVIFPPETEYVAQHAKHEFAQWPVANTVYGGRTYENVDISWWKNLNSPVSFFAWEHESDFFAGYDHGKNAGVVYIGNRHIAPGKKFFTFGSGDAGQAWDKRLTDQDGPYLELMAGGYSDNQPDYSWIQPYETKTVHQYWYPIRQLGGLKFANLNGAVNITLDPQTRTAQVGLQTTMAYDEATVQITHRSKTIHSERVALHPQQPWIRTLQVPSGVLEEDLGLIVMDNDAELIRYEYKKPPGKPMPEPVEPPNEPGEIKTNEELYLTGLRLLQFYNSKISPYPYFEEAIQRDPDDTRVNTQLGILYCQRGMFREAEAHLRRAVARLTSNYTRPRDCEAWYYLGVVQKFLGRRDAAYDSLYRATWDSAWHSAAYFALAQLDCSKRQYDVALGHLDRSFETNALNIQALHLRTTILRTMGLIQEAAFENEYARSLDPVHPWGVYEHALIQAALGNPDKEPIQTARSIIESDREVWIELMTEYGNAGFYEEARSIAERLRLDSEENPVNHPMAYYYMSFYADQAGAAKEYRKKARSLSPAYCFPFRLESIQILERMIEQDPRDPMPYYYLGNLLFEKQPERALDLWRQAETRGCQYFVLYRNLAYALATQQGDIAEAIASMEKAIRLNPTHPRLYFELDRYYEQYKKSPDERYAILNSRLEAVMRHDDALTRFVVLCCETGHYDQAIELLTRRHFSTWEGRGEIHDIYVDALLRRGVQHLDQQNYEQALRDFEAALLYPDNLEVGKPLYDPTLSRVYYWIAKANEELNQRDQAVTYYQMAIDHFAREPEFMFYRGLALRELARTDEAIAVFDRIVEEGTIGLKERENEDFFAKFDDSRTPEQRAAYIHFAIGLGHYGKGDIEQAKRHFRQALEFNLNHLWANYYLSKLNL